MAKVEIKTEGTSLAGLEMNNFATEETLAEILQLLRQQTNTTATTTAKAETKSQKLHDLLKNIIFGRPSSAASAGGDSVKAATNLLKPTLSQTTEAFSAANPKIVSMALELGIAIKGVQLLYAAAHTVSRSLSVMGSFAGNLTSSFVSGTKTLGAYAEAVQKATQSIPIIGEFTSLLAVGAKLLDTWNNTLLDLNSVGATFNGSLAEMVIGAAQSGLTLEEYAKVVKDNASIFSTFGSVMNGARTYTKIANIALNEFGDTLADQGISVQQFNKELPGILKLFGASMFAGGSSVRDVANASLELTKNFNEMAELTGKSREAQAADLAKFTEDSAWRLKLSHLSADAGERFTSELNNIAVSAGDTYAGLFKTIALGFEPINKEQQILLATVPGLSDEFEKMTRIISTGNAASESYKEQMDSSIANIVSAGIGASQSMETLIDAAAAGISDVPEIVSKTQQYLLNQQQLYIHNGQFDRDRFLEVRRQARDRAKAEEDVQKNLLLFSNSTAQLQSYFYEQLLVPFLKNIQPAVTILVDSFSKPGGLGDKVKELVDSFGNWIGQHGKDITKYIGEVIDTVVSVVKFILSVSKFFLDNWGLFKFLFVGFLTFLGIKGVLGAVTIFAALIEATTALRLGLTGLTAAGGPLSSFSTALSSLVKGVFPRAAGSAAGAISEGTYAAWGAGELAAGGGVAAEAAGSAGLFAVVPEILPIIGSIAAVGAVGYGLYKLYEWLSDTGPNVTEPATTLDDLNDTLQDGNDESIKVMRRNNELMEHLITHSKATREHCAATAKYSKLTCQSS